MKIVAFLQNQWHREPEKVEQTILRTIERERERGGKIADEVREHYIRAFLFMGCLTGRRLREVFGDLCSEIIWQEQSPLVGGKSAAAFPPDFQHIQSVLARHKPQIVLAFGKSAREALAIVATTAALSGSPVTWELITGPDPAARHATVMAEMQSMLRSLLAVKGGE